jgi:hypothetical protein
VLPNVARVVSLVDRLLHNDEILSIEGNSLRLKEARSPTPWRQSMSKRDRLPAHHRPLTVEISHLWSPEEALAVFELIDDLRDKILALREINCVERSAHRRQRDPDARGDAGDDGQSFRTTRVMTIRPLRVMPIPGAGRKPRVTGETRIRHPCAGSHRR